MRSLIGAALIAGAFLGPARAAPIPQMQCDRDLLLDMAHEILDRRGQLTGLHGRSFGGTAAYLSLRYGSRPVDDIFTALEEGQPANQVDQLRMAYLIAQNGRDGLRAWGSEPSRILASASLHEQRAILLLDNGTTFFRILGEVQ